MTAVIESKNFMLGESRTIEEYTDFQVSQFIA